MKKADKQLLEAIRAGDVDAAEAAIAAGADVARKRDWPYQRKSPIETVFDCGAPAEMLACLLAHGADPNALLCENGRLDVLAYGPTPLYKAVKEERPDYVRVLLADERIDMERGGKEATSDLPLPSPYQYARYRDTVALFPELAEKWSDRKVSELRRNAQSLRRRADACEQQADQLEKEAGDLSTGKDASGRKFGL